MGFLKNKGFLAKGVAQFSTGTAQNSVTSGTVLNAFQNAIFNTSANISRSSDSVVVLLAGRTYKITAAFYTNTFSATSAYISYQIYNTTTSGYIGSKGTTEPNTDTTAESTQTTITAFITTSVDTSISIKCPSGSGTCSVDFTYSFVIIEEVEAYLAVDQVTAGATIRGAAAKPALVAADAVGVSDSAASGVLKLATIDNLSTYVRTGLTTAPAAGQIGEILVFSNSANVSTTNTTDHATTGTNLTAGTWEFWGSGQIQGTSGVTVSSMDFTLVIDGTNQAISSGGGGNVQGITFAANSRIELPRLIGSATLTAGKVVKLTLRLVASGTENSLITCLRAKRIA